MRPLSVVLLSLAACGGINTGKSFEHPATPEVALGLGFSSLVGKTKGDCVEPTRTRPGQGTKGLIETVFYARSKEEILREVGYSGGVNFGLSAFGVSIGFESLNRNAQSANTSFMVVRIQVEARSDTLSQFELKKHAVETLRRDGPGKFYERCGDGFVSAIRRGGSFLGIIALNGVSSDETRHLSGEAGISFLGLDASGGAHDTARNFFARHEARYYVIQEGGEMDGPSTLGDLQSLDGLLKRAKHFKGTIGGGGAVATEMVIEPYQVTSNRPRGAAFWNLTEQRRFLDQLAIDYGTLQQAAAELKEKLSSNTCANKDARKPMESLHAEYEKSVRDTRQRAEECMNDPKRRCKGRGLGVVDPDRHRKTIADCATGPGFDAPCRIWQFATASAQVSPSTPGGAPREADDSPPEIAIMLWLGERRIVFPTQQSYSARGIIVDGFVNAGLTVKVSIVERDLFLDDQIALLSDTVPTILYDGVLKLESDTVSVSLHGHCVE